MKRCFFSDIDPCNNMSKTENMLTLPIQTNFQHSDQFSRNDVAFTSLFSLQALSPSISSNSSVRSAASTAKSMQRATAPPSAQSGEKYV